MMNACTDQEARSAILEIGRRMFARQYVAANDGNISVRTAPDRIWVTPTGVSKGYMTEDMLLCVDLEGRVLEGTATPCSEMKMHLRVYRENPEVGGVVHAHPPAATSFAIARVPMDMALLTETVFNLGVVPVAPYAIPGTQEVPESIAPFCRTHNAVLLVEEGLGCAFCLDGALAIHSSPRLRFIPIRPEHTTRSVLVWKKNHLFSPATSLFIQEINMLRAKME